MDIREILNAMSEQDKVLYTQHRTEMRRSYLTAHNTALGVVAWDAGDDMFMDYVDITLAVLFDRAGRIKAKQPIAAIENANQDMEKIEASIETRAPKSMGQIALENAAKAQGMVNGKTSDPWAPKHLRAE